MSSLNDKRGQLTDWLSIREFIFGGRAVFTLQSLKRGGERYTYRVKVRKADLRQEHGIPPADVTYFIETLRGPDNTHDYRYTGMLRQPGVLWFTAASQQQRTAKSSIALIWFLERLRGERPRVLGELVEFWHEGRCCRCGRALTVPTSVMDGIGPECRRRAA